MADARLMRGDGWIFCCICFALHEEPFDALFVDDDGTRWDVCAGQCAIDAGLD